MPDSAFWTNYIVHTARAGFHLECIDTMPNFRSGTKLFSCFTVNLNNDKNTLLPLQQKTFIFHSLIQMRIFPLLDYDHRLADAEIHFEWIF